MKQCKHLTKDIVTACLIYIRMREMCKIRPGNVTSARNIVIIINEMFNSLTKYCK